MKNKDPIILHNRRRCFMALISAAVVALCVCVGVVMNLVAVYDKNFGYTGKLTFSLFPVNANILIAISVLLCLPYTIDGLRTGNYHLPNWIVDLMYVAVTTGALTFLNSLTILVPSRGFMLYDSGARFFLNVASPILSAITFCFFINDHPVRMRESPLPLIPVAVYTAVYVVMVMVIGEERGGWNDFYGFTSHFPVWVTILSVLPQTYVVAMVLRAVHNISCRRQRREAAKIYLETYGTDDLRKVMADMAHSRRREIHMADVVIPARVILRMTENSQDDMSFEEGCERFLDAYLD